MHFIKESDKKVLITGCDIDGISRGKTMNASKFKSTALNGFGFCSVIFGWDMHDENYSPKPKILIDDPGYADILA
ncbi:hypothetical protein BC833DRAFT_533839, partial [Globomyces pollinis-pini]